MLWFFCQEAFVERSCVYNDEKQSPMHMRDKKVEQLLERTVDILLLRAGSLVTSTQLEDARKIHSEVYMAGVIVYFHGMAHTALQQGIQDVFDAYMLLIRQLRAVAGCVQYLPSQINNHFKSDGLRTGVLFQQIQVQLRKIEDEWFFPEIAAAVTGLDTMLALLQLRGLAT